MAVGVLVTRRAARFVSIIHARSQISVVKGLVLMVEAEEVAGFLTHDEGPPGGGVVCFGIKVGVVEFGDALSNVVTGDPNLGQAEPAVSPVGVVTDFDSSESGAAASGGCPPGDNSCVQNTRLTPVGRSGREERIPSASDVVSPVEVERVSRARPMVWSPRMARRDRRGEKKEGEGGNGDKKATNHGVLIVAA